ncbi:MULTISPECIES: ComEA family DNA-binding protein [unclassified Rathayibacter]|uniref:ComEA family DNA-binding protein n=1 Tax=unclassified Rathayibacter TaxID=2609250 RepID=UPI00188C6BBA|nr:MULTISPECIES: helix-hairpin-helix domain-containing protein [unclassified Rathayibacter]MBF4462042.1 ComEA family DNA-binding protein [Rathayibacter sp. VKM Ac-2879]MBF4503915.1 ComEA family DNA-binding protein [Rathayibacter sp. VKM Ac-2878]
MRQSTATGEEEALLRPRRPRPRWRVGASAAVVLVVASAVVAVLLAGAQAGGRERVLPMAAAPTVAETSEPTLYVHVAGEVHNAGLYLLSPGARVADAVAAAGGFADGAERAAVNLARKLVDGEQLVVPAVGAAPPASAAGQAGASTAAGGSVLSLSTATAAQLEELPEIGPSTAAKIVAFREANGPFTSVDQLLEVPGIGEKTLSAFRDQVSP